ncbi:hypothetical protein A2783_04685 [Microgenomates group bacterium RIFCSPHIGHO2_01_FULL_45_11]|nr:MAG: hypothetical protein A2783_04685 [Microgenomates group bacterium RIFCSPHIGHO2_01_FULL_45_11]
MAAAGTSRVSDIDDCQVEKGGALMGERIFKFFDNFAFESIKRVFFGFDVATRGKPFIGFDVVADENSV